jgi:hypothetical protein
VNASALSEFVGTAASLHGRVFWNLIAPMPLLANDHAAPLVRDIVARVRRAME